MDIARCVCRECGIVNLPNSCNANLYRDGQQYVNWHADNETQILIISLSLGGTRVFQLRRKEDKEPMHEVLLHDGDICTMEGCCQKFYMHRIPQAANESPGRINLTWRWILKHQEGCTMKGKSEHLLPVVQNSIRTRTPRVWDGEVKRPPAGIQRPVRSASRAPGKASWRGVKATQRTARGQGGALKWTPKART